jgi:hypothetical protein
MCGSTADVSSAQSTRCKPIKRASKAVSAENKVKYYRKPSPLSLVASWQRLTFWIQVAATHLATDSTDPPPFGVSLKLKTKGLRVTQ